MKVLLPSVLLIVILHCHGGLSMKSRQHANQENQRYSNLHMLVNKIRRYLLDKTMIQKGRQFAFVLLGDDTLLNSVGSFNPNPTLILAGQNPDPSSYDNLLVAVPSDNKRIHSETLLLRELFPGLYNAYKTRYNHKPQFILLYSNLMPCGDCTTAIIKFKYNHTMEMSAVKWFVGYHVGESENVPYVNEQTTKGNVARLKANGIRVFKVDFAKKPSLFSEIEQRKREHLQ